MIYLLAVLYLTAGYWCWTRARDKYPGAGWEISSMLLWPLILVIGIVILAREGKGEKKDE